MSRVRQLAELALVWQGCADCDLATSRASVVIHRGEPSARVLIVGDAPTYEDEVRGQPIVSGFGKVLNLCLLEGGIDPDRVAVTTMLGCRTINGRPPKLHQLKACDPRVQQLANIFKPEVVIMLGPTAARLAGHTTVEPWRGQPTDLKVGGVSCRGVITHHPRATRDRPELQRKIVSDIRVARSLLSRVEGDEQE